MEEILEKVTVWGGSAATTYKGNHDELWIWLHKAEFRYDSGVNVYAVNDPIIINETLNFW